MAQGSLTPPGAPAPTMKTLAQVEPRTLISSLPYTINTSGSYYLSTNLIGVFNTNGITVNADDVTLDLNGFAMIASGGNSGIFVAAGVRDFCVRNGTMRDWSTAVSAFSTANSRFEDLRLLNNSGTISAGSNCVIAKCLLQGNGSGLFAAAGSRIQDCVVTGTGVIGITTADSVIIQNCTVQQSGSYGIFLGYDCTVSDCTVQGNGNIGVSGQDRISFKNCNIGGNSSSGIQVGVDCVIKGCNCIGNGFSGIDAGDRLFADQCNSSQNTRSGIHCPNPYAVVRGCTVAGNGFYGILLSSYGDVSDCTAITNTFTGIDTGIGSKVSRCTCINNTQYGIFTGYTSTVSDCTVRYNGGDGIYVPASGVVLNNTCDNNGGAGIRAFNNATRVEGNRVYSNQNGIRADSSGNLIIKNLASGNGTNYVLAANNSVGVIVSVPVSGAISGSTGGAGVGTTDPWANFSY